MSGPTGITLNPGNLGAVLGVDADANFFYQIVKIGYSVAGTTPTQVSATNPLPVDPSGVTSPVSVASLPLPAGAAKDSSLTTINTTLGTPLQAGGSVSVSNFPASQTVSVAGLPSVGPNTSGASLPVVIASDQAPLNVQALTALPVVNDPQGQGLTVSLTNSDINNVINPISIAGTVQVAGTFFQATQPVSVASVLQDNLVQINGAVPSAANPLPVQLSDGSQFSDLANLLKALTTIQAQAFQLAANPGFFPSEISPFLGV